MYLCDFWLFCRHRRFCLLERKMSLAVDSKEHGLIRALAAKQVAHEVRSLAVGDALCTYESGGCPWIVERKRADGLAASINDGR